MLKTGIRGDVQYFFVCITINGLAGQFYISPSYLSRVFKKVTGFHLQEYIRHIRIREAKKRLRDTDEKILDIAADTGFKHISHFNKVFKEIVGICRRFL